MPPYSSSNSPAISPASAKTSSARATSGISSTLPSTIRGSFSSAFRLCGAKCSVAICSARSRTASNVSRECSAYRSRLVSDSTSSHSWSRKSRSRRDRISEEPTASHYDRARHDQDALRAALPRRKGSPQCVVTSVRVGRRPAGRTAARSTSVARGGVRHLLLLRPLDAGRDVVGSLGLLLAWMPDWLRSSSCGQEPAGRRSPRPRRRRRPGTPGRACSRSRPGTAVTSAGKASIALVSARTLSAPACCSAAACCAASGFDCAASRICSGISVPSRVNKIDRKAAVPMVPPIWRKNVTDEVATPDLPRRHGVLHGQDHRLHVEARGRGRSGP